MQKKKNASRPVEEFVEELVTLEEIIPREIFILPVFSGPIFPGIITPIIVSSTNLIEQIESMGESLNFIGLVLTKNEQNQKIDPENLYRVGTVAKIMKKIKLPGGGLNLLVNSLKRFEIEEFVNKEPLIASVNYHPNKQFQKKEEESISIKARTRSILGYLRNLAENNPFLMEQIKLTLANIDEASKIGDFAVTILKLEREEYQKILEIFNVEKRLDLVLKYLDQESKLIQLQKNIQKQINTEIDQKQREFFLKEQLKAIKRELGMEEDPKTKEYKEFQKKIQKLKIPDKVRTQINRELEKFKNLEPISSEYAVTRNYLEWISLLPWGFFTPDDSKITKAQRILESDHYGLLDVKQRILEFLAVKKLNKKGFGGSILCFVGPPGVGKTSLGKSIARALNRKFYRFSLGGIRDEAEIKGHRRTYVGAMPGKILQGIRFVESANPVFMLDEIDKIGISFQGDPASALLEVLDPEQNKEFVDHYLDLPFDLSEVLFLTTANTLDNIPQPLLDRMEVIRLSGYIEQEKYEIARRYLVPKQLERHGLKDGLKFSKSVYLYIIQNYARESGVRSLERQIEKICRKTALLLLQEKPYPQNITQEWVQKYLGPEIFTDTVYQKQNQVGVATGLAWTSLGGSVLFIESIATSGKGELKLTGQLGSVMSESANIAYSYVKKLTQSSKSKHLGEYFDTHTIHLHVPAGATPKDGPSAGITMAVSMFSLLFNIPPKKGFGMTGELTLTGQVLPIGGLKEKIIASKRMKLKAILFPAENQKDLHEIDEPIKKGLELYSVQHFHEVQAILFPSMDNGLVPSLESKLQS